MEAITKQNITHKCHSHGGAHSYIRCIECQHEYCPQSWRACPLCAERAINIMDYAALRSALLTLRTRPLAGITGEFMNTPEMKIAKSTLKMAPAGARVMGGMDYESAYELVFRTPLRPRLESLVAQYGDTPIAWELGVYGWDTPSELLAAL